MTKPQKKKEKKQKPKYDMWQNSAWMISLAWKYKEKKILLISFATAILAVGQNLVNLYISPTILSAVERKAPISELLITIGVFAGALMLISALSTYVGRNNSYGKITLRSAIGHFMNQKSSLTSYPNLDKKDFCEIQEKALKTTINNRSATEAIWDTLSSLLQNVLGFVFYVGLLSTVQPILLGVIFATSIAGYYVNKALDNYRYRHRDEENEPMRKMGSIRRKVRWSRNAAKDIRIFGLRPWLDELFDDCLQAMIAYERKLHTVMLIAPITGLVLAFLRNGVAYAYLIYMVMENNLPVSDFLLYFTAVGGFSGWVSGILGSLSGLHSQSIDISMTREFLEYPEPFKFEDGETLIPEAGHPYEIKLEDVSFTYPNAEKATLEHIHLTLRAGEKVAVVGLNGAGKTTLVKLICGLYDPTEGRVTLDGKDIRDYNRRDYYKMFSAVFQNFSLMAGTVAANVAQTEENIDMARVRDAIEKAGLTGKVNSLAEGFETKLNREVYEDGAELSGGETQRLMLARALYKDAPMLILDEPTAALDPIAEAEMYHKYNEMSKGKTSVYISHRLASTRFCDRILYIENGVIAEEGTHEELLRCGGRYAELFNVQSKYYREGEMKHEEK